MTFLEAAGADDTPELRAHFEPLAKVMASGEPVDVVKLERMHDAIARNIKNDGLCRWLAEAVITVDPENSTVTIHWYRNE